MENKNLKRISYKYYDTRNDNKFIGNYYESEENEYEILLNNIDFLLSVIRNTERLKPYSSFRNTDRYFNFWNACFVRYNPELFSKHKKDLIYFKEHLEKILKNNGFLKEPYEMVTTIK